MHKVSTCQPSGVGSKATVLYRCKSRGIGRYRKLHQDRTAKCQGALEIVVSHALTWSRSVAQLSAGGGGCTSSKRDSDESMRERPDDNKSRKDAGTMSAMFTRRRCQAEECFKGQMLSLPFTELHGLKRYDAKPYNNGTSQGHRPEPLNPALTRRTSSGSLYVTA